MKGNESKSRGLMPYLNIGAVLALSFGYAVGWGSFVMPGTTFLPNAGPLGTVLGMTIGALAMCVFAWCYHVMSVRVPNPGGAFSFAQRVFGDDHGFLVGWFLCLTYIAILWANATAIVLLVRYILGDALQFGFHYVLAGFDVYLGEVLLALAAIALALIVCLGGKRLAARLQTWLAVVFVLVVAIVFGVALCRHTGGFASMAPAFSPGGGRGVAQIFGILAMAPWAFVGYEAISHSAAEFAFPVKRMFAVLVAAVALSLFVYLALALLPTLARPDGYATWYMYIQDLPQLKGIAGVPVFAAAKMLLGTLGVSLIVVAMLAGLFTGIIASFVAMSRLMYAMAREDVLPRWFGELDGDQKPRHAILFVALVSLVVPFFGRAAIRWPVDVSSLGAALAFGYTSAAAYKTAQGLFSRALGICGGVLALILCLLLLVPNYLSGNMMEAESYLLLAVWCILVFLAYRRVFLMDRRHRFGQSIIVWISLIIIIIFSSVMWIRESSHDITREVLLNVGQAQDGLKALPREMQRLNSVIHSHSFVEIALLIGTLFIIANLLSILRRREHALTRAKAKAEELNKAKSFFFSTVSHDIRTPLNAIIGFSQMLQEGFKTPEEHNEAVDSILVSSKTLLNLVNDVLDLSKLESGRMQIVPEPTDCTALVDEVVKTFKVAHTKHDVALLSRVDDMPPLLIDPQRLRQILFNLVGNAVKFTDHGHVEVRAICTPHAAEGTCSLRLEVEDTGCGISEADLRTIASPYTQFGTSGRRGGTGLGLAISRQLACAMGGDPQVVSTLGQGSTFSVDFAALKVCTAAELAAAHKGTAASSPERPALRRLLVADDQKMNLIVLKAMLGKIGDFDLTCVQNGREALEILENPDTPPFDLVLTDMWMPEMSGEALVKAIRLNPHLKTLRVYAITADVEAQKNVAELGFTGLLLKPVTLENLREIVG